MASIANKIAQIRQAIFGKDVRESLASGLEAVNDEVESTTSKQEHLEDTFNQLVINAGNSNAEIVDARVDNTTGKSYGKVGDRLDEVSAHMEDDTNIKNQTETYFPVGTVTPKAVYNSGGHIFVISQKPNGNGYIRARMRDDVVTSDSSVGGTGQLMRVVEVLNVTECFSLQYTDSANSDSETWAYNTAPYGAITVNLRSRSTAVAGAWIEYQVTVPKGIYYIEALIYGSTGSSTDVNIAVDGSNVITGTSFQKNPAQYFRTSIPITPGTHTVRFTTVSASFMSIAGVNVVDLNNYKSGYNFDKIVTVYQSSSNQYITNGGAIDYALFDSDLQKYCGSYHGGETRSRIAYILDGTEITLSDGTAFIGKVLEIEQDTVIVSKLNAYSRYIYKQDGNIEFEVYFNGNINLTRLFTNMTTAHVNYTKVIYPKVVDTTSDGTYYMPLGSNYVIQKNPTNNQKIITVMNDNMVGGIPIQPYVQASSFYKKLYKENIKSDTPVNFTGGNFKAIHIFE